jgi:lambda family phage portal protein
MNEMAQLPSGLVVPRAVAADHLLKMYAGPGAYPSARLDNKNTAGWITSHGSADSDILYDQATIRSQARDLSRSNALACGAIGNVVTNAVGLGLRPQLVIDFKFLGMTEEAATAWQREAERLFWLWAESKNADASRKLNFFEQQALVLRSMLESGDVLALFRQKDRSGWKFSTCLKLMEGDRLGTPMERIVDDNVRSGVKFDSDGEPIAYHILKHHPGDQFFNLRTQEYTEVPAYDKNGMPVVLHMFKTLRPEQTRGVSYLAPVIEPLKQIGRYSEAEITAAVVSAMFSVFIETPGTGTAGGFMGGGIPGQVNGIDMTPKGSSMTKLASGMIIEGLPGEKISTINPGRPNTAFEPFVNAVFTQIGVGLGQPKEVMMRYYQSSYSAARAAILDGWKTFRENRTWAVTNFCQPCLERVLFESVARGYLVAPGFLDNSEIRSAYCAAEWAGTPMGSIDPLKEGLAAEKWLSIGATTLRRVTQEHSGEDWEETLQQRKREKDAADEMGLTLGTPAQALPGPVPAKPLDAQDENEEKPEGEDGDDE